MRLVVWQEIYNKDQIINKEDLLQDIHQNQGKRIAVLKEWKIKVENMGINKTLMLTAVMKSMICKLNL